jgi:inhibitor of cysteine peptidase
MGEIHITKEDEGKTRSVHAGDTILIQLFDNPTTGYRWEVEAADERHVTLAGTSFSAASPEKAGSGGTRTFAFSALSPGATEIRLVRRRSWEAKELAVERFAVSISILER